MWTTMNQRLALLGAEMTALPPASQATIEAQRCAETVARLAAPLQALKDDVHAHARRTTDALGQAQLELTRWNAGSAARMREIAARIVADVAPLQAQAHDLAASVGKSRTEVGAAAGTLSAAGAAARARLKVLENEQQELEAKARQLRDRSAWTWLFLPAKAIDELVSVFQHGKSTEAALEDTARQIDAARRQASESIRAADLANSQAALLERMAQRLQALVNQLGAVDAHLRGEKSLAQFDDPALAKVMLATLQQVVSMLDAELN